MKWSLYMQLPTGKWIRTSNQAYELRKAEVVWADALLDAIRTRGPARELRQVEDGKLDGADVARADSSNRLGLSISTLQEDGMDR